MGVAFPNSQEPRVALITPCCPGRCLYSCPWHSGWAAAGCAHVAAMEQEARAWEVVLLSANFSAVTG